MGVRRWQAGAAILISVHAGIEPVLPPEGSDCPSGVAQRPGPSGLLPGWYAVSVGNLHSHDGRYDYFWRFRPVATAGYSICVYHVTPTSCSRCNDCSDRPP